MATRVAVGPVHALDLWRLATEAIEDQIRILRVAPTDGWVATSRTPGRGYMVDAVDGCSCEGYFKADRCRHWALLVFQLGWLPDPGDAGFCSPHQAERAEARYAEWLEKRARMARMAAAIGPDAEPEPEPEPEPDPDPAGPAAAGPAPAQSFADAPPAWLLPSEPYLSDCPDCINDDRPSSRLAGETCATCNGTRRTMVQGYWPDEIDGGRCLVTPQPMTPAAVALALRAMDRARVVSGRLTSLRADDFNAAAELWLMPVPDAATAEAWQQLRDRYGVPGLPARRMAPGLVDRLGVAA